jgi:ADP-ribose pyrophosphatase YjhB (NUDIX family)
MEIDHRVQLSILKQLLFAPRSRFSELNRFNLDNDHFVFHLQRLVNLDLVQKKAVYYSLTPRGIETAGRLDLASLKIVKKPKVGVLIFLTRKKGNRREVLLGRRRRDPGKGKSGFYAGKVRFGEPLEASAARCLFKETGLRAKFSYVGTVHVLDKIEKDPKFDRLMVYFHATDTTGNFIKITPESSNYWVTLSEIHKLSGLFPDFQQDMNLFKKKDLFFEERYL